MVLQLADAVHRGHSVASWDILFCGYLLMDLTRLARGPVYRMIPTVFELSVPSDDPVGHERKSAAALGFIGAIGGFGGFAIPQVLNLSDSVTGDFSVAFWLFAAAYVLMALVAWGVYHRPGTRFAEANV